MMIGSVMVGRADEGLMVFTPEPGILNAIVSVPAFALASRIACLKEPAPLSFVLVTVKVCPAGLNTMARRTRTVDAAKNANRHRQRERAPRDSRRWERGIIELL